MDQKSKCGRRPLGNLRALVVASLVTSHALAQCVTPPDIPQPPTLGVSTLFAGTTFSVCPTPPNYCVSLDPGVAIRCDLSTTRDIQLATVGANFLNDGGTYGGVVVPNLVGAPNGTCEVWIAPNNSVLNPALFANVSYTHNPPSAPPAPWQLVSNQLSHINNLVFAPPDNPSTATFSPPLMLPAGNYAVVFVFVPKGVASIPPGLGTAANAATDRIHPLFTNLNSIPYQTTISDGNVQISNLGVQSSAFSADALEPTGTTPYLPNLQVTYVDSNVTSWNYGYSTNYGTGCGASSQTFLETWLDGNTDIDGTTTINGLDFYLVDESLNTGRYGDGYYFVTLNSAPGLWLAPGSTVGSRRLNSTNPDVGAGWSDGAKAVGLPFNLSHPNNITPGTRVVWVSANGIVYLEHPSLALPGIQPLRGFSGSASDFFGGPSAIAAAWTDLDITNGIGGSGDIWYDTDGASFSCFTWVNCQAAGEPGYLSTFQIVLHAGGHVRIRFATDGIRTTTNPVLTGYSAGGGTDVRFRSGSTRQDPDYSTACLPSGYTSPRRTPAPAALSLQGRPVAFQPLTIVSTIDYPASVLNISMLSLASMPGIELSALGMPGCSALIQLPELASFASSNIGGSARWPVTPGIPGTLIGNRFYAQSAQLVLGGHAVNAASLLVSNALCINVGNY
jgi:hypothetical protein